MLRLDSKLVEQQLRERGFEGLSELALALGVHRSTLWRWLHGGPAAFPGSAAQLLKLGATLDVDPLALVDYATEDFARLSVRLQRVAQTGDWNNFLPALEFLGGLLNPSDAWPPAEVAAAYGRPWTLRDLTLEPMTQGLGYHLLRVEPPGQRRPSDVFGWHLAFQDTGGPAQLPWHCIGYLRWRGDEVRMHTLRGLLNHDHVRGQRGVVVEVFVGPQAGTLRIASLHEFTAEWAERRPAEALLRVCEQGLPCVPADGPPCELSGRCTGFRSAVRDVAAFTLRARGEERPARARS